MSTGTKKKSTAVAVVEEAPALPLAVLNPNSRAARAFSQNVGEGGVQLSELASVKVPSGTAKVFSFEVGGVDYNETELVGVPVQIIKRGTLWPTEGDSDLGQHRPLLVCTSDWTQPLMYATRPGEGTEDENFGDIDPKSIEAHKVGTLADGSSVYSWLELDQNKWGTTSKGTKKGKRVDERAEIILFRKDDVQPLRVSVPPSSVRHLKKMISGLSAPYFECVFSITLVTIDDGKAPAHPEMVFKIKEVLSEEVGDVVATTLRVPFTAATRQETTHHEEVRMIENKE